MGQEEVYKILKIEYDNGRREYLTSKQVYLKLRKNNIDLCLSSICVSLNRLWRNGRLERRQNKWGMWTPGFRYREV